jgi:cytochrome c oxidase subunit 4
MDDQHIAERRQEDPGAHMRVEAHAHPGPREYVRVAVVLAVITAAEVGIYYITQLPDGLLIALLLSLMLLKFAGVALYFMHLKFDSPTFSRFFIAGLTIALVVFAIVLSTFGLFVGNR